MRKIALLGGAGILAMGFGSGQVQAQQSLDACAPNDGRCLSVLAYNVRMVEGGGREEKHEARGEHIASTIRGLPDGGPDVLVLSEAFHNRAYAAMRDRLFEGRYMDSAGPPNRWQLRNGGVRVVSKWPIVRSGTEVFRNNHDFQKIRPVRVHAKGVVYVEIEKRGTPYHIFGTHMQHACGRKHNIGMDHPRIRRRQIEDLIEYIEQQSIPDGEPIIVAGDMNAEPDGSPTSCSFEYLMSQLGPGFDEMEHTRSTVVGGRSIIDHVPYKNMNLDPRRSYTATVAFTTSMELPSRFNGGGLTYLSDHHPLLSVFQRRIPLWSVPRPEIWWENLDVLQD
ncbi:endonuclease/exonuclease/phosphatase family protein [Halomonas organivorans]